MRRPAIFSFFSSPLQLHQYDALTGRVVGPTGGYTAGGFAEEPGSPGGGGGPGPADLESRRIRRESVIKIVGKDDFKMVSDAERTPAELARHKEHLDMVKEEIRLHRQVGKVGGH